MKVVIVGSGLIGITSAYFLARRGLEVTVIDRRRGPGLETSFANGALLTPSMAEPWNAPGSWRVLLRSLGRSDSALQLRVKTLPKLVRWGALFIRNSSRACYERNTLKNLTLALHSLQALQSLRKETGIEYGQSTVGTLRVFRERVMLERAVEASGRLRAKGLKFRRLTNHETVDLEPALAPIGHQLAGGIHYFHDESGNAYQFCVALADLARRMRVDFMFDTALDEIEVRSGKVSAIVAGGKRYIADQYILAAGSYTPRLLVPVGIDMPVQPAKGYSISFEGHSERPALRIPVADDDFHAVVVPVNRGIRVAGTAEFSGYDLSLPDARIGNLMRLLKQVLPQAEFDRATARPWCGLRPMSADGVPIIGPTSIENLWVNTGHGHLGWTLAVGSGQLLADVMTGKSPEIDAESYALARFSSLLGSRDASLLDMT